MKDYLKRRIEASFEKRLPKELKKLELNEVRELTEIVITVEWKKNRTWGANPRAEAFVLGKGYLQSSSIGGCGYDKKSTAVAEVLNQVDYFKKLLFEHKNKRNNFRKKNSEVFGYGSGYGILPNIEGGVGVSCYTDIFSKIGFKFEQVSNTKTTDVFRISKK